MIASTNLQNVSALDFGHFQDQIQGEMEHKFL